MRNHVDVDAVVLLAERDVAPALARIQLDSTLAAYRHIFPAEAPLPTIDDVTTQWQQWLGPGWDEDGRRAFTAHDAGIVVGVVLTGPDTIEPQVGHLARLYVTPDRWARGIGSLLYSSATDHLRASGFDEATLWVLEHNQRARRWYERLGWRATGERKATYPPARIDSLRYRTRLTPSSTPAAPRPAGSPFDAKTGRSSDPSPLLRRISEGGCGGLRTERPPTMRPSNRAASELPICRRRRRRRAVVRCAHSVALVLCVASCGP